MRRAKFFTRATTLLGFGSRSGGHSHSSRFDVAVCANGSGCALGFVNGFIGAKGFGDGPGEGAGIGEGVGDGAGVAAGCGNVSGAGDGEAEGCGGVK